MTSAGVRACMHAGVGGETKRALEAMYAADARRLPSLYGYRRPRLAGRVTLTAADRTGSIIAASSPPTRRTTSERERGRAP